MTEPSKFENIILNKQVTRPADLEFIFEGLEVYGVQRITKAKLQI